MFNNRKLLRESMYSNLKKYNASYNPGRQSDKPEPQPGTVSEQQLTNQRVFTEEELAYYDGSNGKPAYAAVNGIVYDVSLAPAWGGGTHFGLIAGRNLTPQFNGCHVGRQEALRFLPKVGTLETRQGG